MDFYRNMGYGYGSNVEEYRIPSLSLPKWEGPRLIRFLGPEDTEKMLECQKAFAGIYHGMVVKFEDEIRAMHADTRSKRIGCFADGMLKGYAVYDLVSESPVNYTLNSIDIKELFIWTATVSVRSWLFQGNRRILPQIVTLRTGEEDFYHILPSAQDISGNYIDFGFLQTNVGAVGTMYKIVDPSAFVRATSHRQFPAAELTAALIIMMNSPTRIRLLPFLSNPQRTDAVPAGQKPAEQIVMYASNAALQICPHFSWEAAVFRPC